MAAAAPPITKRAFPVIIGIAPADELLVPTAMDFVASKNCASVVDVEVTDGLAVLDGVDVDLVTDDVEEGTLVVDTVELGRTKLPAVTVTTWLAAARALPPSVKVVVALAAVEVMVPRAPASDLLHSPWSDAVITHPTSTVLAGSSDAVGRWE